MEISLKTVIDSIKYSVDFKKNRLLPENHQIDWLPVIQCGDDGYSMGILENGGWAIEGGRGLFELNHPCQFFLVMVLMEQPFDTVYSQLKVYFRSIGLETNVYDLFPFGLVVKAGFEQGSEYWAKLAFDWYQELPQEIKISLVDSLANIVTAKWASQKLRQKAKKETRRIEQQQNNNR